jgi:hypothetical protein
MVNMVRTKMRRMKGIVCVLFFILTVSTAVPLKGESSRIFSVSINNLNLKKDEYVVGFQMVLLWVYVYSLPRVPPAYNVCIENDPMWKTIIKADISGPIRATSIGEKFFQEFLLIKEMLTVKFKPRIEIIVKVTKEDNIDETRDITVPDRDIVLKEVPKSTKTK